MKLQIKVIPSSSKDCIVGWLEDTLKIKVKAPADKGKANKAVIKVLEESLSLPRGSVIIKSGLTSCLKTININVDNDNDIRERLARLPKQ
ncbi:MAG: DUF167 domain-containing protein [Gammaproteobacteria bacterium]|nr:DUF167 domain-containing protein [Gammaproteobacteria bacterium]